MGENQTNKKTNNNKIREIHTFDNKVNKLKRGLKL